MNHLSNWDTDTLRLKLLTNKVGSGKTPKGGQEVYSSEGVVFLRSQNVYDDGLRLDDVVFIDDEIDEEMRQTRVRPGDVLLNITGASIGRTCIVPTPFPRANVNQHVCIIRLRAVADPSFVSYSLKSFSIKDQIRSMENGSSREGLNFEQIGNLTIHLPPITEQRAIGDYLDRKTAQIDALISKKQRQIELLGEKRQALISQAVTKGLDLKVPMKDSGVDWLGEIPKHWSLERLKFRSPHVTVGIVVTPSKYYEESGVPCLRSLNVRPFALRDHDLVFMNEESNRLHSKSIIRKGDLVAVRTGQPGTTAIVDERFDGANCIDLILIRQSHSFESEYLCYFMNSQAAHVQYGSGSGGAIQQHFNIETAANLLVPWPPVNEQEQIVEFLNDEWNRLGRIEEANQRLVDKLRQYRQTLISAAVTGKIDVTKEAAC